MSFEDGSVVRIHHAATWTDTAAT